MAFLDERNELIADTDFCKSLHAIAYNVVRNREDARDVVQNALEALVRLSEEALLKIDNLKFWMRTVVRYNAIAWLKKQSGAGVGNLPDQPVFTDPCIKMEWAKIREAFYNEFKGESDRTVFEMYFVQDLAHKQTAAVIGKDEGAVRKTVFAIRKWAKKTFIP